MGFVGSVEFDESELEPERDDVPDEVMGDRREEDSRGS